MSSAPDPHGHDAPDAHAFTGEPVQVLPPDEPRTPGWLPLLGLAFFTSAAVVLLVRHGSAEPTGDAAVPEAVATATAVAVKAAPVAAPPPAPKPPMFAPPGGPPAGAEPPRTLTPEQIRQARKTLEQGKGKAPTNPRRPAQ
jgi:hypothetical protein